MRADTPPTMSTPSSVWTCPTCLTTVDTPFCPTCGERPVRPLDLSAKGIFAQVLKTVGGLDGRVVRSVRDLRMRPGALTVAYQQGRASRWSDRSSCSC